MRRVLWSLVLLLGCGGGNKQKPADRGVAGGVDGGVDGGIDGGVDGGLDGGTDGGVPCVNTVEEVPLEARLHIPETQTPVYVHNPPVSGEHYPRWASWQIHTQTVPRGYYVHNLEHG